MKKVSLGSLFLVLLLSTVASAGDWVNFRGDSLHSGNAQETLSPPLVKEWTFTAKDKILSSAAVLGETVFFGSRDNTLYALEATNGTEVWRYEAGNWIDSSPAVTDKTVYITTRDGNWYALNSNDGKLLWKFTTGGTDSSSATVSGNVVLAGTGFPNKRVYALDAQEGKELWRYEAGQMVYSSAAVKGDAVFIGANDGYVYCFNKDNGKELWKYQTSGGIYYASPAINDSALYIAAGDFDWNVYALRTDTGKLLWKQALALQNVTPNYVSSVAIGDGRLYLVAGYTKQFLYCLDADNGRQLWKAELGPALKFGFSSSPVVTNDAVYACSGQGKLKAFANATGQLVWEYDLGAGVLASPTVSKGYLYIGTLAGKFMAFRLVR